MEDNIEVDVVIMTVCEYNTFHSSSTEISNILVIMKLCDIGSNMYYSIKDSYLLRETHIYLKWLFFAVFSMMNS